jgi:hypothetical protein
MHEKQAVDSNGNRVRVSYAGVNTRAGKPVMVVDLLDGYGIGYLAVQEDADGGFGDAECPSSVGMKTVCWYGLNESFCTADIAIRAYF